ncbi:hypothetical protein BN1723_005366 [Verticillium longisporum]|uniref:ATPase AAA-type core domain-containing protein n=1 Tax=Verticillium longisporum TaxID=100787 RepID=A0A0G4N7Z1_VERLO|nr:hypothetical protein BN1723_005366 [Verticillium longisporum]
MPSVAEVPPGGPASTPEVKITSLPPLKPDLFERAWSSTPHPTLPLLATAHGKSVTIFSLASLASHSTLTGGHTRSVRSENLRNVLAVSRSMNGDFESESEHFSTLLSSLNLSHRLSQTPDGIDIDLSAFPPSFTTSVLSGPDVYHIARLFHGLKLNQPSTKTALQIFLDVIGSHSANIVHASNKADEEKETSSSSRTTTQQKAEPERVQVGGHKYNEFEKKLLTGLVDVKEIRTTFADVHAPPATISALKLLTSLSLVRPEAFAYGVLANDRLPGCLLYGPPGTGKTLLAKA